MIQCLPLLFYFLAAGDAPLLTHGVASGDVTGKSAILWARASADATLESDYDTSSAFDHAKKGTPVRVARARDFTGQIVLKGLQPATRYYYRIRARNRSGVSPGLSGSFVTAPRPGDSRDVHFLWAGDLGGQGFCRKPEQDYLLLRAMTELAPDFVLFSGDMIYADSPCPSPPNLPGSDFVAATLLEFRQRWKYNREDPGHQKLLATTSIVSQWDDHEVVNDFAGPFEPLMRLGRQAYFEYHPITPNRAEPYRVYRKFRWGQELELFILDNRQYRAANSEADGPSKSMLGRNQYRWLLDSLSRSEALWKVIATSVPLTVPTGSNSETKGRDGWANGSTAGRPQGDKTGWEHELMKIFEFIRSKRIRNVIWITTDVHFAQMAKLDPFHDDNLASYELICGPLSAVSLKPAELDTTLNPTRIYAEGEFFNFGSISIDARNHRLACEIRGLETPGRPALRHSLTLDALPR